MKRLLIITSLTLLLLIGYSVLVLWWARTGLWYRPAAERNDTVAFMDAVKETTSSQFTGNLALALMKNGKVEEEYFVSFGRPVDRHSMYQVASLSKYISAWGIMALVRSGRLKLDSPAEDYLTRWHLPPSAFNNQKVTISRLLSHTAGLTDGLGYMGFIHPDSVQSLEESLTRAADPFPGAPGVVVVENDPGSTWQYSGGGFTLLQLIVEEVSGMSFSEYMDSVLFEPLNMAHSGFKYETLPQNLVDFYDVDSTIAPHYRYTALAAASLYTNLADLEKFFVAHLKENALSFPGPETLEKMSQPRARKFGLPVWGLGTMLYAPNGAKGYVVGHDGGNRPAINTTFRINPATGDGIIILSSGTRGLASALGSEWVFWNTGYPDLHFLQRHLTKIIILLAAGWLLIILTVIVSARRISVRHSEH